MAHMTAAEMARKRWENVTPQQRSELARSAALARWAAADENDFAMARNRARFARAVRATKLLARTLGVEVSELDNVNARLVSAAKFRQEKTREQNEHWRAVRKRQRTAPPVSMRVYPQRKRRTAIDLFAAAPDIAELTKCGPQFVEKHFPQMLESVRQKRERKRATSTRRKITPRTRR